MGLDVYAGTITRYYARTWKTISQQSAESMGIGYQVIRPNETDNSDTPSTEEIQAHVSQWVQAVASSLSSSNGFDCPVWEENGDKDYFTHKPDWLAFEVLQLFGACLHYGLPFPEVVSKGWDCSKDETLQHAFADEGFNWSLYSSAEWWLPFDECFLFRGSAPNGANIVFSTTALLLAELDVINRKSWQADEETILSWIESEGYPADGYFENGEYIKTGEHTEYSAESLAKFAFAILYKAALYSKEHRVPIILDY